MSDRREQFGDTPALQDKLAALVATGRKCATTSLARWYGVGGLRWPIVGETWAVDDGDGHERCRCRTTRVEIRTFGNVGAEHAAAEGERDGSLEQWREIHRAFFARQAARHDFIFDENTLVLLERFEALDRRPNPSHV